MPRWRASTTCRGVEWCRGVVSRSCGLYGCSAGPRFCCIQSPCVLASNRQEVAPAGGNGRAVCVVGSFCSLRNELSDIAKVQVMYCRRRLISLTLEWGTRDMYSARLKELQCFPAKKVVVLRCGEGRGGAVATSCRHVTRREVKCPAKSDFFALNCCHKGRGSGR